MPQVSKAWDKLHRKANELRELHSKVYGMNLPVILSLLKDEIDKVDREMLELAKKDILYRCK